MVIVTHKNSSFDTVKFFLNTNVGILIQNTCKCLLSKQYNGNIVNKVVKDTRLEYTILAIRL